MLALATCAVFTGIAYFMHPILLPAALVIPVRCLLLARLFGRAASARSVILIISAGRVAMEAALVSRYL